MSLLKRHPNNTNLVLHDQPAFAGMSLPAKHSPYILSYLNRLYVTIDHALTEYPRVFAFRVDLHFPVSGELDYLTQSNQVIEKFMASFKAKIQHHRLQAQLSNPYAHHCRVRYVWARETAGAGRPHYHVALLLNHDAFHTLGRFEIGRANLYNRLLEAWASALGVGVNEAHGLIHIPQDACYVLHRADSLSFARFFSRVCYLCKAATKHYGNWLHGFGSSRG